MLKREFSFIICCWFFNLSCVFAQQNAIKVGARVPDFIFSEITNNFNSTGRFSDYKNKVVILDFWGVSCTPCIAALPKYDSLQRIYLNDLQIIPVTSDKKENVDRFLNRMWKGKERLTMPFVVNDSLLKKYFPHTSIPHEVWINRNGIVVAITSGYYVNEPNIQRVINNEEVNFPVKDAVKKTMTSGIFDDMDYLQKKSLYHSYIGRYSDKVLNASGAGLVAENNQYRVKAYNKPIRYLYTHALSFNPRENRIFYENIKDSSIYLIPDKNLNPGEFDKWFKNNAYCYESTFAVAGDESQSTLKQKGLTIMYRELNNFFGGQYGLSVTKEVKKINCWVLIRNDNDERFKTVDGKNVINEQRDSSWIFKNIKLEDLIYRIDRFSIPIIDGTYYKNKIDLTIPLDGMRDIMVLKKVLNRYGFDLVEDNRDLEILVFREQNTEG